MFRILPLELRNSHLIQVTYKHRSIRMQTSLDAMFIVLCLPLTWEIEVNYSPIEPDHNLGFMFTELLFMMKKMERIL